MESEPASVDPELAPVETRATPMESGAAPVDKGSSSGAAEAPGALLPPVALFWLQTRLADLRTLWRPA